MADINEKVNIETRQAVENLDDLSDASKKADEWIDNVIDRARKADQVDVEIPVEAPGAKQVADELDAVDTSARKAGEGAKIGTQNVSDLGGMFGDAGGQASQFGQAVEGAGAVVENFAQQLGLSEEASGKLNTAIGLVAVGVAAAAAAWQVYKRDGDAAKKGLDETRDALGQVYDKIREGDQLAAAKTFVDTMGDKIEGFRQLLGGAVSKADIAGVIFGDPNSIDRVNDAVGRLDGTAQVLATGSMSLLRGSWDDAKKAMDENTQLESTVQSYFGNVGSAAQNASQKLDIYTDSLGRSRSVTPGVTAAADAAAAQYGAGNVRVGPTPVYVTNNYPPANTPLAVDQATTRWNTTQGY